MADQGPSVLFRPGGLEFSSDEDDERVDNFCFGVASLDGNSNRNRDITTTVEPDHEGNVVPNNTTTSRPTDNATPSRGGFGVPAGHVPHDRGSGMPAGVEGSRGDWGNTRDVGGNPKPSRNQPPRKERPHMKQVSAQVKPVPLEDFKTAVVRGNMEELQKYLDQGVPVNEVLRTGWTALMYASNYANVKAVTFLLDRGANPNYHTDHYTVLMAVCASTRQDQEALCQCAQLLIDRGVDVNHFDRYHMSPLMYAVRHNKGALVKLLLEAGAHKDKQDNRGYTALSWAASQGHVHVVHILLEAGADLNKLSCDGSKPADLALTSGHEHIAGIIRRFGKGDTTASLAQLESIASSEKPTQNDHEDSAYSSQTCKYGALEMFLLDAGLEQLIDPFQQNHVTFEAFLRFTDSDLQQLGISQLGIRKKLLTSINTTHKQTWESSSLPSIQYNKLVTCHESVTMVVNLSNHASYMATSAGYISDQLRSHPQILTEAKDGTMVLDLCNKTEEALAKVRVLYNELGTLRKVIGKETSQTNFEAPDIIKAPKTKRKTFRTRRLALVGIATVVGLVVWKWDVLPRVATRIVGQ